MDRDVQPPEPVAELLAVAASVTPAWLRRITSRAAVDGGVDLGSWVESLDTMVESESERLLSELEALVLADVDDQHTNPLSLFRSAVAVPTAWLRTARAVPPPTDRFVAERFPDDVYGLGPATWADIDPRLHEPGLTWGAWKAMTVMRRRRDEGVR